MRVVGLDPAFANFGLVYAELVHDAKGWSIIPAAMDLLQTKPTKDKKVVRKSSDKLARAHELYVGVSGFMQLYQPDLIFVEVPSGAQNADAAAGLGIAIGILGSISYPIIEVAPREIKQLFTTKQESVPKDVVRNWAYKRWPNAPWLTHAGKRTLKNEHMADALACIEAGLKTPTFKQLLALRGINEVPMSHNDRPASGRPARRSLSVGPVPVDQPTGKRVRRQVNPDIG